MNELDAAEFRQISADETIALRHSVLWPNHPISYVRLPEDDSGFHYGAFLPSHEAPIAIISLFKESLPYDSRQAIPAARFRKFACDPLYQGRGIGTRLLRHVFETAHAQLGCTMIWCDARLATAGWYERRGMVRFGDVFFKEDVEYVRMEGPTKLTALAGMES